jgi:hypothetical protein
MIAWLLKVPAWLWPVLALGVSTAWFAQSASVWQGRAKACADGRQADRAAYIEAQLEATRASLLAKQTKEAEQEAARKEANNALETARRNAHAQLSDWMRRQTVARYSGRADLPATAGATVVDNGPDRAAFMVETQDLNICTDNTTRLQNAQEWAKLLVMTN